MLEYKSPAALKGVKTIKYLENMNRNITILVVILVVIVISGYLLWLRSGFQPSVEQPTVIVQETPIPSPVPTVASPSATTAPASGASTESGKTVR